MDQESLPEHLLRLAQAERASLCREHFSSAFVRMPIRVDATDQLIAAVPCSQTQGFARVNLEVLTEFLRELAALARTAGERGERPYCWIAV